MGAPLSCGHSLGTPPPPGVVKLRDPEESASAKRSMAEKAKSEVGRNLQVYCNPLIYAYLSSRFDKHHAEQSTYPHSL